MTPLRKRVSIPLWAIILAAIVIIPLGYAAVVKVTQIVTTEAIFVYQYVGMVECTNARLNYNAEGKIQSVTVTLYNKDTVDHMVKATVWVQGAKLDAFYSTGEGSVIDLLVPAGQTVTVEITLVPEPVEPGVNTIVDVAVLQKVVS